MFKTNVLVLGSDGMLGYDVLRCFQALAQQKNSKIGIVTGIDKSNDLKLERRHELGNYLIDKIHYDVCINCIAYTDTAAAQNTKEGFNASYLLNAQLPKHIAESCKFHNVRLIHISTDYVFSELSQRSTSKDKDGITPFSTFDVPFPTTIYGIHKLLGEEGIKGVFGEKSKDYAILRTSWLYGWHKEKSFVHKFIRNLALTPYDKQIDVTENEWSVPTSTDFLCECIKQTVYDKLYGTLHAVPYVSDGVSRADFAEQIAEIYDTLDCEQDKCCCKKAEQLPYNKVKPIESESFRPKHSAMEASTEFNVHWKWEHDLQNFMRKHNYDIANFVKQVRKQEQGS